MKPARFLALTIGLLASSSLAEFVKNPYKDDPPEEEEKELDEEEEIYSPKVLGWGSTDQENEEKFMIYTNPYHLNMTDEVFYKNNLPSLVYTIDSETLTEPEWKGKNTYQLHNTIMVPVLKEVRGMAKVYVFDCQHPKAEEMKDGDDTFFKGALQVCDDE